MVQQSNGDVGLEEYQSTLFQDPMINSGSHSELSRLVHPTTIQILLQLVRSESQRLSVFTTKLSERNGMI